MSTPSLEDLALHAVHALDAPSSEALERAVASSPALQAELTAMQSVLAKLGRSIPQTTPSAALEPRIFKRISALETLLGSTRTSIPGASLAGGPRNPWTRPVFATVSLMALALVAFPGVRSNQLQTQLDALKTSSVQQTAILSSGSSIQLASTVSGATPIGQAFLTQDGKIVIALKLPAPEAGKTYQAWFIPKGESAPRPLETFDSALTTTVPADASAIAVSLEPSGGSTVPTTVLGVGTVRI
jgi:anti-sigma-K factor RskA